MTEVMMPDDLTLKGVALSWSEFVGMVAHNPDQPIEQKMFRYKIQNDHEAIEKEKWHTDR